LELRSVSVNYSGFAAVRGVSMQLAPGEIGCLLGPSGCGKTTVLRAIAGFEPVSAGEISLHGRVISAPGNTVVPENRRVGMVFQDFALFPHLNVARNVGFGLSGLDRTARRRRVDELLELVGLASSSGAYPHELSGGQQQRVALARALAPNPEILLLDEPFSSLDSELREQLAAEVRELLKRNGVTAVLVTHDQHEAFAMADRVTVMHQGRAVQSGTPHELYREPAEEFVAGFIGLGSLVSATVDAAGELDNGLGRLEGKDVTRMPGQAIRVLVRPEDVTHDADSPLRLQVAGKSFRGSSILYELSLPDGQRVACLTPSHVEVSVGEELPVCFDLRHSVIFEC
jgi:iron(III) transport system ATP-binding protein